MIRPHRLLPWPHRDLFIIFVLKVLESYNYFSLSRIFVLYLTENFGVDDLTAGTLYGLWGTLLVLYGFILGGAIDFLGEAGPGRGQQMVMGWGSRVVRDGGPGASLATAVPEVRLSTRPVLV